MAGFGFRTVRVIPGPGVFSSTAPGSGQVPPGIVTTARGTTYVNPGAGGSLDIAAGDAQSMLASGWLQLGLSGTTANRPALGDPDWWSLTYGVFGGVIRYFDTTLAAWIHSDPTSTTGWRNSTSFAAV